MVNFKLTINEWLISIKTNSGCCTRKIQLTAVTDALRQLLFIISRA